MPLSAGDKLGPYEIVSPIGEGGMGEVYKARDTRLERSVAIKVLPEHIAKREDLRARFEREARAVASLNHPNICVVHDIGSLPQCKGREAVFSGGAGRQPAGVAHGGGPELGRAAGEIGTLSQTSSLQKLIDF